MSHQISERADAQHPWIGLASFTESDRSFFAGRTDEIDDLVRLVRRDTLTLLYGVSGLGKTSLVQAGLFPALRKENFLPVPIRLDYLEGALPLARQIIDAISAAAVAANVESPEPRPDETLWEYFHREGNHFWGARNDLVTPFLAFDQFEELFTLGRETPDRAGRASAFISELADLVENRPPAVLRDDPLRAKEFSFKTASLRVLLAMREDYLAELDRVRFHFRALGQNRLRLLPMGERQARQVIALGAALLAPGVENRIVNYAAGGTASSSDSVSLNLPSGRDSDDLVVAPALLSLVLRELNERRLALGPDAKITADLLDVEQHKIFEAFYFRTLQDFPVGVRLFIEDELLTASGHRNSCALDDALAKPDVTLPVLNELVNRRLLAYEDRRTRRVELTHDVLVPAIKASRDSRLTREAVAQADRDRAQRAAQRRKKLVLAVACVLAITLIATIWGGYYGFVQEHRAYYREFTKRNGFPVGVGPISKADARRLATSYVLVSKGVSWEGWRLRWNPAFRMVAVDNELRPTTNQTVGTYLLKEGDDESDGEEAGQSRVRTSEAGWRSVCQWEFVSSPKGEIIYERALDRDGRMVYGLVYSPPGSGLVATRLARFVGPDGFAQKRRSTAAEYVSIHYDQHGWEDLILYRDAKNLPAAGPDGAFGQRKTHNSRGQVTLLLSLDVDGKNMIDHSNNCGLQITYNDKGWLTEARSIGPDLQPMPLKVGWYTARNEHDELGRVSRLTYYGIKGEPILNKDGYHGFNAEYDERGNQTTTTYIGLNGKPTLLGTGVAIFRSRYNSQGKMTNMTYHGTNGEPVLHKDGNHGWEAQYDQRGNQVEISYLGLNGQPDQVAAGYAIIRSDYDARNQQVRQSYFGPKGEPVLHKDGNHAWESQYDDRGNEIATTFLSPDGKPVVLTQGYASIRRKYDSDSNELEKAYFDDSGKPAVERESSPPNLDSAGKTVVEGESGIHRIVNTYDGRGKVVRKRYFGPEGKAALHTDGNHGWDAQYDDRGNKTSITYIGLDERPLLLASGFATLRSACDASGRETKMTLHGAAGEPVLHRDGHHGWELKYDERGRRTEKIYLGLDGKPIAMPDGYATIKWKYDTHGNTTLVTYYGIDNEPRSYKNLYHGWESRYDERGNEIATIFIGVELKPILVSDGYAILKAVFDEHGKATRTTYYGVNEEPVLHKEGYHGWESEYDERGNELNRTFVGLDGKPISLGTGFATMKAVYNARGKTVKIAFYGTQGEPGMHRNGYHGWESEYDERGNETATTYFGLDEKPALLPAGYAIVRSTFDSRGNITGQTYHGVKGEPVLHKDGYHGWKATYDERGKPSAKTYIDMDGKPVELKKGDQR